MPFPGLYAHQHDAAQSTPNHIQRPFHGGNTGSNPVGDANNPFPVLISSNMVKSDGLGVFQKAVIFGVEQPLGKEQILNTLTLVARCLLPSPDDVNEHQFCKTHEFF